MIKEKKINDLTCWNEDIIDVELPAYALKIPKNDLEYQMLEGLLDRLIDIVKDDENHFLADVMEIIGDHLEAYDDRHYQALEDDVTPVELVQYLMQINNLKQKDLVAIFGSQGNVSSFLNGRRKLSPSQIKALRDRFHISADCLIE
ncbi:MAG: transcriptional regulator [Gammaproteobacteria bacterium]|nr:MAG: transcriptional regulator [Gammaproteobacteria bacterium]UTW42851.1 transcriptional regulator [bacterium SCSIO 12844]